MDRIQKRFDELREQVAGLSSNNPPVQIVSEIKGAEHGVSMWNQSARALIAQVFPAGHPTRLSFDETASASWATDYPETCRFMQLLPIFDSAKEQYEGGYVFEVQNLVHAEVFSNELEQAEHFLKNKYDVAAAVTAGVVLETTIKKLCTLQSPPIDLIGSNGRGKNTDTLISELKAANVYSEAVAKQLRAWMNVRNDAAHGTRGNGDFDEGEIRRMIDGVQDFVAKHMN